MEGVSLLDWSKVGLLLLIFIVIPFGPMVWKGIKFVVDAVLDRLAFHLERFITNIFNGVYDE